MPKQAVVISGSSLANELLENGFKRIVLRARESSFPNNGANFAPVRLKKSHIRFRSTNISTENHL